MNAIVDSAVERIWLKSYPAGVPADINPDSYGSINDVFNEACRKYRNLPGFTCLGKHSHTRSLMNWRWRLPAISRER